MLYINANVKGYRRVGFCARKHLLILLSKVQLFHVKSVFLIQYRMVVEFLSNTKQKAVKFGKFTKIQWSRFLFVVFAA